jgi:hypothetical protein
LSLYEPDTQIVSLMEANGPAVTTRHIHGRRTEERTSPDGVVRLPACGALVWIDPTVRPLTSGQAAQPVNSRVSVTPATPGESFVFRGFRLLAVPGKCE